MVCFIIGFMVLYLLMKFVSVISVLVSCYRSGLTNPPYLKWILARPLFTENPHYFSNKFITRYYRDIYPNLPLLIKIIAMIDVRSILYFGNPTSDDFPLNEQFSLFRSSILALIILPCKILDYIIMVPIILLTRLIRNIPKKNIRIVVEDRKAELNNIDISIIRKLY